ncbi:MAG: rod shape-determining protein MreD [Candidatus Avilachnospira sp.]
MNRHIKLLLQRALINILILLGAFTVQTCVFPLLPMFSAVPNLLLILTFSFGFIYGRKTGMLCGLAAGVLMDLFYTGPFGFYCLIFLYIGFFNGIFNKYYYNDFIQLPLILCAVNELIYNFYIYVLRFLVRGKLDIGYYFMNIVLPEMVFSLIFTLFLYRVFLGANKRLDVIEDKRGTNVA